MISNKIENGLNGEPNIPGDKSISHRSIIIPSISNGICEVNNYLKSDDVINTLKAFTSMGVKITQNKNKIIIYGNGLNYLIIDGISEASKKWEVSSYSGIVSNAASLILWFGESFVVDSGNRKLWKETSTRHRAVCNLFGMFSFVPFIIFYNVLTFVPFSGLSTEYGDGSSSC